MHKNANIQLGIVEDITIVRENLQQFFSELPDVELSICSDSMEGFLAQLRESTPINTLLLDNHLPGMSGIDGIYHIKKVRPDLDIIMLTVSDDSEIIFRALCAGAVSYIAKKSDLETIYDAISAVHRGESYMSPSIARKVVRYFNSMKRSDKLTPRQEQIVAGLVDGLSYKLIADRLGIGIETVRDHIKNIYRKLEVNSKAEVISKYHRGEI